MKILTVSIKGASPYSQSAAIQSHKKTGEGSDAFEERTWRERMHTTDDGRVFLPPMAIKNCLSEVARYLSESVPGKGKSTYTKHFEAGVLITSEWVLTSNGQPVIAANVPPERLFVPADGKRGSGKRVYGRVYGFYAKRLNDGVSFRAFYALILQIGLINYLDKTFYF
jgi:hypothetical protein